MDVQDSRPDQGRIQGDLTNEKKSCTCAEQIDVGSCIFCGGGRQTLRPSVCVCVCMRVCAKIHLVPLCAGKRCLT